LTIRTSVVVGNPKPQSRTWQTARAVIESLTGRVPDVSIDLVTLGPRLLDWNDADVAAAIEHVKATDLLVVASPTFKGTYTGLLKLFLDRFGAGSLVSVTAVPLMVGGDWRHSLAPEVFLKPVLSELGASTPTRGLFLLDSELTESEAYAQWLTVARNQLDHLDFVRS
jgi:FMN reductase